MDLKKETTEGECKVRCWIDNQMQYLTLEELETQVGEHDIEIQNYTLIKAVLKKMGVDFYVHDPCNTIVPKKTLDAKRS